MGRWQQTYTRRPGLGHRFAQAGDQAGPPEPSRRLRAAGWGIRRAGPRTCSVDETMTKARRPYLAYAATSPNVREKKRTNNT